MGTWNSRGLRGSTLEDMINYTNTRYEETGLALIQKIPTQKNVQQIPSPCRMYMSIRSHLWKNMKNNREFPF